MGLTLADLDAIVFDFDGVLTDNHVYVHDDGTESVRCSRADGLAFDALRQSEVRLFILSTEQSSVVSARAKKLGVLAIQGSCDKRASLLEMAAQHGFSLDRTLFVGNDVNDLAAMETCGVSACPADSHPAVRRAATIRLKRRGGDAVVRELVEDVLGLNLGPVHRA